MHLDVLLVHHWQSIVKGRLYYGCVKFGNNAYILGGCTENSVVHHLIDRIVLVFFITQLIVLCKMMFFLNFALFIIYTNLY